MYHKDHPWGRGVWIWRIKECLGGDIDAIIKKCHDYKIEYLIIKTGNGTDTWTQLTPEIVQRFHEANIKVYSWSYCYGDQPTEEAQVALHSLVLGVDGHVFDAEGEYERVADNAQRAETMLKLVRAQYPGKFLAYSPFPIIDYHTNFPYVTFGKYCDAVLPQIYFGTMKRTPQSAVLAMYDNFVRWQKNWINAGHADSVKPIIPAAQGYDNYKIDPPYILKPEDILAFVSTVKRYKSVNFYSFQDILRDDCWEAIRNSDLDVPTAEECGIAEAVSEPVSAPIETAAAVEASEHQEPADSPQETASATSEATEQPAEVSGVTVIEVPPEASPEEQPAETITVHEEVVGEGTIAVEEPVSETVDTPANTTETTTEETKPIGAPIKISADTPTKIIVKPNDKHPDGVEVKVYAYKTHREYFVEFIKYLISLLPFRKF